MTDIEITIENLKIAQQHFKTKKPVASKFDIMSYGGIHNNKQKDMSCGTSACLLGEFPFIPGLEPDKKDYVSEEFCYVRYSGRIMPFFNFGYFSIWGFIFGQDNPNDFKKALIRLDQGIIRLEKWS